MRVKPRRLDQLSTSFIHYTPIPIDEPVQKEKSNEDDDKMPPQIGEFADRHAYTRHFNVTECREPGCKVLRDYFKFLSQVFKIFPGPPNKNYWKLTIHLPAAPKVFVLYR